MKKTFAGLMGVVLALASVELARAQTTTGPYAIAPQQPNFYRADTNQFPMVIPPHTTTNLANPLTLTIRQGTGLSIFTGIMATNTPKFATTNATYLFDVASGYAGDTNYTTFGALPFLSPAITASNYYVGWTNFSRTVLDNVRTIKCTSINNPDTNSLTISNLVYSWSGQ